MTIYGTPDKMEMASPDNFNKTEIPPDKVSMTRLRIIKNLLVVCVCFLLLFTAYQALANLQSTLNIEDDLGVVSQSVIYIALIVSSLFLPKLIIKKLGCKLTLVFSVLTYAPYIASNFYPHMGTMVPAAIVIGIGAAPLWSAKCTYINEISVMFANYGSDTADVVTSKFFGIFFTIFQNTQIWGNLISFYILKPSGVKGTNHTDSELSTLQQSFVDIDLPNVTCGIEFCSGINENLLPPSEDKRYMLIGVYLGCAILASVITAIFLDPLPKRKDKDEDENVCSKVAATLRHLRKTNQILLVPLTIFSGIEQAFILSEYTKAYVACAWGLYNVGLVFICFGVVNAVMSFTAGRIVKYVSRKILMVVAAAGNAGVCIALHLWHPREEESVIFFVLVGVWGLSDAVWQTQINALYGVLFRSQEEAAFANYRLWESFGFAIAFGYSSALCVAPKIYIMLAFLAAGMIGYMVVEMRTTAKRHTYSVNESCDTLSTS